MEAIEGFVHPELVGRGIELARLRDRLDRVAHGGPKIVLVSGEAGIGKTRLIEELKGLANGNGVQVLSGHCLYESVTPYMPILEALRGGSLGHLLAETAPRVEGVYLLTTTGLLVKEAVRTETDLDPDVFASMLSTVGDFLMDSLTKLNGNQKRDTLTRLDYGNHSILIEREAGLNLAVLITGKETEFLISEMQEILQEVWRQFGKRLEPWSGEEEDVRRIERILSPLMWKFDGLSYEQADPKGKRTLLFENVSLGLARQAQIAPVLLCLEDLQWADPSTLALVHYIAKSTQMCDLLVLGTYRPEDLVVEDGKTHHLAEVLQRMAHEGLTEAMKLDRLPESETARIVHSLLGADLDQTLVHRLHVETEGNPFFIVELTKLMVEEGIIRKVDGSWIPGRDLLQADIPARIHDVVVRRISLLDQYLRDVLDCASVIGEEYDRDVLAASLHIDKMGLLQALAALERKHGLVRSRNGRYSFDHVKIKEVLYEELPTELKKEYHARVATTLVARADETADSSGEIAFHYLRGDDPRKALPYLLTAANCAAKQFSNEEALRFYSEALEIEQESGNKIDLLEAMGAISNLIGDHNGALRCFHRLLDSEIGDRKKAEVLAKTAMTLRYKGQFEESLQTCNEGLVLVKDESSSEEALILSNMGTVSTDLGDYEHAVDYHRRSLAIREKIGDLAGIAESLNAIGVVFAEQKDSEQALDFMRKSLQIREKIGDLRSIARLLSNIGAVYDQQGKLEEASDCYRKSLRYHEKIGDLQGVAVVLCNLGSNRERRGDYQASLDYQRTSLSFREKVGDQAGVAFALGNVGNMTRYLGNYEEALDCHRRSLAIMEKIGHQPGVAMELSYLGDDYAEQREYDQALDYHRRSLAIMEKGRYRQEIGVELGCIGVILGEQGDFGQAIVSLTRSLTYLAGTDASYEKVWARLNLAEIHLKMGDLDLARSTCEIALSASMKVGLKGLLLRSHRISGMIYLKRKAWLESIQNFEESIRISGQIGDRLGEAKSHYEFGLMWKAKGDNAQAFYHFSAAATILRKIKVVRELERVREAEHSLSG